MQKVMIFLIVRLYIIPLLAQTQENIQEDTSKMVLINNVKKLRSETDSLMMILAAIDTTKFPKDVRQKLDTVRIKLKNIGKLAELIQDSLLIADTSDMSKKIASNTKKIEYIQRVIIGIFLLFLLFQIVIIYLSRKIYIRTSEGISEAVLKNIADIKKQLFQYISSKSNESNAVKKMSEEVAQLLVISRQLYDDLIKKLEEQNDQLEQIESSQIKVIKVIETLRNSLDNIKLHIEHQHTYPKYSPTTSPGHDVNVQTVQQKKPYRPPATEIPSKRQIAPPPFHRQQYISGDRVNLLEYLVDQMANWHNKSAPEKLRFKKEVEKLGYELLDPYLEGYDTPDKLRKYPYIRFFNIDASSTSTPIVLEPAIIEKTTGKPWKMGKIEGNIW